MDNFSNQSVFMLISRLRVFIFDVNEFYFQYFCEKVHPGATIEFMKSSQHTMNYTEEL